MMIGCWLFGSLGPGPGDALLVKLVFYDGALWKFNGVNSVRDHVAMAE